MNNNVIIKRINDWLECYQNKDNGFYNATELLRQYNEHYPNERKEMYDFFRTKNTQKYIGSVLSDVESPSDNSHDGCKNTKKTKPNIFGMVDNEKDTLFYVKKGRKSKNTQVSDNQVWDNSPIPNNQQVTEKSRNGEKSTSLKNNELYYFKKGRALKGGGKTFGTWLSPELERDIHKVLWNNILEYRNEIRQLNPYFYRCDKRLFRQS